MTRRGRRRSGPGDAAANGAYLDLFADPEVATAPYGAATEPALCAEPNGAVGLVPGTSPRSAISVATITRIARDVLEGAFTPLWVRGEVSDFKAHRNGHWYFCLRDETSQIHCVLWSRDRGRIPAPPDDGMQVVARGQLTVYPARGDMQLVVTALEAVGDGLWRKALELTRARLEADGLLAPERKRALPRLPHRIAVVTSPDGAALHDVVAVVRRRCPSVEIIVAAAKVQGDGAPEEIAAAIERVSRWGGVDVVIVGRGGGAREDLWAFNDERVARSLAACAVPTVSAVGHEIDVTLCDLVADVRAATPSAAAEAAVPLLSDERATLAALGGALRLALERRVSAGRRELERASRELTGVASRGVERRRARMDALTGQLHTLSPLATLGRGFSVAQDKTGKTLTSASAFPPGMLFQLLLRDGVVFATVNESPDAASVLTSPPSTP